MFSPPSAVIDRFKCEFDKLLYLGLMLPLENRPEPELADALLKDL